MKSKGGERGDVVRFKNPCYSRGGGGRKSIDMLLWRLMGERCRWGGNIPALSHAGNSECFCGRASRPERVRVLISVFPQFSAASPKRFWP